MRTLRSSTESAAHVLAETAPPQKPRSRPARIHRAQARNKEEFERPSASRSGASRSFARMAHEIAAVYSRPGRRAGPNPKSPARRSQSRSSRRAIFGCVRGTRPQAAAPASSPRTPHQFRPLPTRRVSRCRANPTVRGDHPAEGALPGQETHSAMAWIRIGKNRRAAPADGLRHRLSGLGRFGRKQMVVGVHRERPGSAVRSGISIGLRAVERGRESARCRIS